MSRIEYLNRGGAARLDVEIPAQLSYRLRRCDRKFSKIVELPVNTMDWGTCGRPFDLLPERVQLPELLRVPLYRRGLHDVVRTHDEDEDRPSQSSRLPEL